MITARVLMKQFSSLKMELTEVDIEQICDIFFRGDKIMNILGASSNDAFIDQPSVKIPFLKKMNSFLVKKFYLNFFKILNVSLKHLIYRI